jgi:hypothetical protein
MKFVTVPFNVVGGTYESRIRTISGERAVNMFPQLNPKGKAKSSLQSFPGQRLLSFVDDDPDRGMHNMNESMYRVVGSKLFNVDSLGVHTLLGSISGGGRCIFADDGDNLVIVASVVYVYTKSSDTLQVNTNVNLVDVSSVTFIKSQFIYTTPDLSFVSQPNNPFDVSGLDAIGAESNPDKLVRDYAFNQTLYRTGVRTTEPWYVSGVGSPPIDVIEGQQLSVGVRAIHSLANTDRALYWLGDDKAIYRISGGINERISDEGLSNTIEEMTVISDAVGYAFTLQGQDFYLITFPTQARTFVINESLGKDGWFELRSGKGLSYSGTSLVQIYDKLIIANRGKLLTLELNEYTQDSDVILRERITNDISAEDLGLDFDKMTMSTLTLKVETGVGLVSGQGENPRIMVEVSTDGGRSYPSVSWVEIGRAGEHTKLVEVDAFVTGEALRFKFTMSDPVPLTILGAKIKVKGQLH